jgi:regulator of sirC expression with transglutaminase-like and TPR domain
VALHRAMGLILLKEDQQAMARKAFRQYLRQNPKAEDAEMIRHLMKQG